MLSFVSVIHAFTCVFIIVFILLQNPKGGSVLGNLGGGGGGQALFGSEGASSLLVTITKYLAIIFACTSFYLSFLSSKKTNSILTNTQVQDISSQNTSDTKTQNQKQNKNTQHNKQK